MARQRLTDEQLTAIRVEKAEAGRAIEVLRKNLAIPGVTTAHPQLQPYIQVLLTNPQVPKLAWFSAIRFQGYEPMLMARYPGFEAVAIGMRDAACKGGYMPAEKVEWPPFKAAIARGLSHDQWEAFMKQLPELPPRPERKVNPAVAAATNLVEFLAAQQAPRPDEDEEDEDKPGLTPGQQLRLSLHGAEPSRTPAAPLASLPDLDLASLMGDATPPTPAPVVTASVLPKLDLPILPTATANNPNAELRFKLELVRASDPAKEKDVELLLQFVDSNPEGVRKLAAVKGIAL